MWAYMGCSSHSHSINMFAPPSPTHFKKLKRKLSLEKNLYDNMHKPRLFLNLNKITG